MTFWHASTAVALAAAAAGMAPAATVTINPIQDTFAWAEDPSGTYGSAGALSVSGAAATNAEGVANGVIDTWMMFAGAEARDAFDAEYGVGNWELVSAVLSLREVAAPNNPMFNRGVGQFAITHAASDDWSEGPGGPGEGGAATGNQIGYDWGLGLLGAGDESLGTFTNAGVNGFQDFRLGVAAGFAADVLAGDDVSLYLAAVDDAVGFTFNSRSTPFAPELTLEAAVIPGPGGVALLGLMGLAGSGRRTRRR